MMLGTDHEVNTTLLTTAIKATAPGHVVQQSLTAGKLHNLSIRSGMCSFYTRLVIVLGIAYVVCNLQA